jgi:CheY-like chemotaxis protein
VKQSSLYNAIVSALSLQSMDTTPTPLTEAHFDTELAERHPMRILLAEDNSVNQKLALRMLERMGYRADVAANGLEVLDALHRQPYDLVLMDVQMPEMDGLTTTRRLRAQKSSVYIVAMTANAMEGDREECLAAGMNDYVSKPIQLKDLQAAIARFGQALEK